jgi:hypothetical protein
MSQIVLEDNMKEIKGKGKVGDLSYTSSLSIQ